MPDVFLHGSFYIFLYSDLFIFENIDLLPSICYPHFRRIPLFTVLVPDTSPRTYSPNESPPRTYSPNELFPREIRTRVYKNSTVAHIFTDFTGYQVP
jgi:hypothetical protein